MNLHELLLRDVKCFEQLKLPCSRMTVLTGYNAGGKSTALHALLLMAQAVRSNPTSNRLSLNGEFVNLGSVGDVIRHGASTHSIVLGVAAADEELQWKLVYDRGLSARGVLSLEHARYRSARGLEESHSSLIPGAHALNSGLLVALDELIFLGPARETQLSTYPVPRTSSLGRGDVGKNGEYAAYWYLECADDGVDAARRHKRDLGAVTVRSQMAAWIEDFFPGARVSANRLTPESPVQLAYRLHGTGGWVPPPNVGYGLGYAFPMLVAMLTAKNESVIVIDSAEAHMHPRAQSAVGHFLGQMAGAGLQIFLETHSDHLLNGIRLAVRDGLLCAGDVAVHFFDAADTANRTTSLTMDKKGAISDWPEGFFDQAERDLAILSGWH